MNNVKMECSFSSWYAAFEKDSFKAKILLIPDDVLKYLEHGAFLLPLEAVKLSPKNSEWTKEPSTINEEEEVDDYQPTFPEFSQKIQDALDEYGAVFIKSNWSSPMDATWIAPTKTLKCSTLEEVYLLLKSSDRIVEDLSAVKSLDDNPPPFCLVLKQWQDLDPCGEFRCFVVNNELIAISQRDTSQYYRSNESEKYDIQTDIKNLFSERIKGRFPLRDYSFDVIRHKKNNVKIVDFGPMNEQYTKEMLFTYEELQNFSSDAPEFRFIGEEIGICPKSSMPFCIPKDINEFFKSPDSVQLLNKIQKEVESQRKKHEEENADALEST